MRIVTISCVRNEADIIEPFVRHALSFCERIFVLNHGSTDATAQILDQLRGEGLPLEVIHDATLGHMGEAQINRLLQLAATEYAADWIIPLDADEFICGSHDASFLPPLVEGETPCIKLQMRTYYCKQGDDPNVLNPVERMTRRLVQEPWEYQKAMVPGYLARKPGSRLVQGSHRLIIGAREAPFEVIENVRLAHYSLRTPAQYALKITSKQLQRRRRYVPHSVEGAFYKETYNQIKRSYSAFARNFEMQPLPYLPPHDHDAVVADPLHYLGGPLRYTSKPGDFDEYAEQLLLLAERFASSGEGANDGSDDSTTGSIPLLSVEAYPFPDHGVHAARQIQAPQAATHSLEFDLDCDARTTELRIGFGCLPGLIEIEEMSLIFDDGESALLTYRHLELSSMLRVIQHAAVINTERACWLFVSSYPVLLRFDGWKDQNGHLPRKLQIKLSYQTRMLEGKFLHLRVLAAITREKNESIRLLKQLECCKNDREDLLKKVTYSIGSTINFSREGNGVLFMRKGWGTPEAWGSWTDGCEATLLLRFAQVPRNNLQMNACVRAFLTGGHMELQVNIRVNGERIATWKATNKGFLTLQCQINLPLVRGGACEIAFEIVNPLSPKEAGISNDARLLGLAFKSVDFQECRTLA